MADELAGAPVALFWGDDGFVLRLAAHALLEMRGLRPVEVDGRAWQGGETSDLATPSLWGDGRALLVTGCQGLPEAGARELRAYLSAPSPEALCVLTLITGGRGTPPLARAVESGGGAVRQVSVKRQNLPRWVLERARVRGLDLNLSGASTLVDTLGEETAVLDQAVEQLTAAFAGRRVGPEEVHTQFQGLGEQRVWNLCDQAFSGRLPQALVALRSLLDAKEDPLLILGGIAARLREMIRVRSLPSGLPPAEAARTAGLRFDWQLKRSRQQSSRYRLEDLVALQEQVAATDRALKGGAGDLVLPALVAAMSGERDAALELPVRVSR